MNAVDSREARQNQREASQCYTCGRYAPSHHAQCPDHPYWLRRSSYLSQVEIDDLIPVGEWAYSDEGLGLGARYRRDVAALYNRPVEPEGKDY